MRSRHSEAWVIDPTDRGKLAIEFDASEGPVGPRSEYWVHWTDYNTYSIVGGPSGKYLWLLSRNPTIKAKDVEPILDVIRGFGYDTDKLVGNPGVVVHM